MNQRPCSLNEGKNVPEQRAMTVDNAGYEEALDDYVDGPNPNVESASEVVKNLLRKLADVTNKRDSLSNENKS